MDWTPDTMDKTTEARSRQRSEGRQDQRLDKTIRQKAMAETSTAKMVRNRLLIATVPFILIGCSSSQTSRHQEQMQSLQKEVSILQKQMEIVTKLDKAGVNLAKRKGCEDEASFILLRTIYNCSEMNYAAGLLDVGLTPNDAAIWSSVLAIANGYSEVDNESHGSLFGAVRGAIQGKSFRENADPKSVIAAIRRLPGSNLKDFYAMLADTEAGRRTALSRQKVPATATATEKPTEAKPQALRSEEQGNADEASPRPEYCQGLSTADCTAMKRIEQKLTGNKKPTWEGREFQENQRKAWAECKKDPTLSGC